MMKQNILWKKRIAFLLSAAMIIGEIGSDVVTIRAAEVPSNTQTVEREKTVSIPEEYISLNDTEDMKEAVSEEVNVSKEGDKEEPIPIIGKDDWQVTESCVAEEILNSDGDEIATNNMNNIIPSVIPVINEQEVKKTQVNASDVTTPAAITLGESVSKSGYSEIGDETETASFSFIPEEDGYYGFEIKQNVDVNISISVACEDVILMSKNLYSNDNYTGFISCKLEAGKTYVWNVEYYAYCEETPKFTLEFNKHEGLEVSEDKVSGIVGKMSAFQYQAEQSGLLQISLESKEGYNYYLDIDGSIYKISKETPLTVFMEKNSKISYTLWKNVEVDDDVTLTMQTVEASEIENVGVALDVKALTLRNHADTINKISWTSFVPSESGYYAFENGAGNSEIETDGALYRYCQDETSQYYTQYSSFGNGYGTGIVYLAAGIKYYYMITQTECGETENALSEYQVMVTKVDNQVIEPGECITLDKATRLVVNGDVGKIYTINVNVNDGSSYMLDTENVQIFGSGYSAIHGKMSTKLCINSSEDNAFLFSKIEKLTKQSAYTVELKEYDAMELQEDVLQENEEGWECGDCMICKFIPKADGLYNFWGINYTDTRSMFEVYQENGSLKRKARRTYSDEFDVSISLEKDKTYYLVNKTVTSCKVEAGDFILCQGKAESGTIDMNQAEQKVDLSIYKSAKIELSIPEAGFYQFTATGSANSYQFKGAKTDDDYEDEENDVTVTLYNKIARIVYFSSAGEYTVNLSREFPKGSGKDNVTLEVKQDNGLQGLKLYTKENPVKEQVKMADSEDECWYVFTPEETGSYTFVVDGTEYQTWSNISVYEKNKENNCLESMDYYTCYQWYMSNCRQNKQLQKDNTYYVKVTSDGGIADLYAIKDEKGEIEDISKSVTVKTVYGVRIACNIPTDGLYEIDIQGQKSENYTVFINEYLSDSQAGKTVDNKLYRYLGQGTQNIIISSSGNEIGEDSITVKITAVDTKTEMKSITMDKKEMWIKYSPEESGYYTVGSLVSGNENLEMEFYKKTNEKELLYLWGDANYWSNSNTEEVEEAIYLEKGCEYFLNLSSENVPRDVIVYAQKNETVAGQLGEEMEIDISKRCNINIGNLTEGFYEVSLSGVATNDYKIAVGMYDDGDNKYQKSFETAFSGKESKAVYISANNIEYYSNIFFDLSKTGAITKSTCKLCIKKVTPVTEEIKLDETISKVGTSNVICYTFTPEQSVYFGVIGKTDDRIGCREEQEDIVWYIGTRNYYAGKTYEFYVLNQKNTEYSFGLQEKKGVAVYDYNTYNAFIASGGTITIQKSEDVTEDMWEDDMYSMYYLYDGNYVVCSAKDFINKNDIWTLGVSSYMNVPVDVTYQEMDEELQGRYSYDTKTYNYKYQYLCNEQGEKVDLQDKLESKHIVYAIFAPEYVPVQRIEIQGETTLKPGDTAKLTAKLETGVNFEPTNKEVTWSSSDDSIVSVDKEGNIKANKEGKVVITCTSKDIVGNSGSITIVVANDAVYATKVVITGPTQVNVGSSITLKATIDTGGKGTPTQNGVNWKSSSENIAKVDANGKVTGVSAGKVTISAISKDGKAKAEYNITVKNVVAKKIKLNASKITIKKGTTYKWLSVSFTPKNTTEQKITWSTSNKKVATVDSKGRIKGKGIGKATITATSSNGKKDTIKVTVTKNDLKAKKIKLPTKKNMKVGDTLKLSAEFTPINTTNKKVKWKSSNTKIATVNSKGVVKAKKAGKVTITATTLDGTKKTSKCKITIKK